MRKNNPKSKLSETYKKTRGMYDAFEDSDTRSERMFKLGLDPNNHVHIAAADALLQSEYLRQKGKKQSQRIMGKN